MKLQTYFSQDLLLFGYDIFPQVVVICLHLIKHIRFNTLLALPVCIPKSQIVEGCHEMLNCYDFNFHALFLKIYIFEVAMFYLTLHRSNQLNFFSGSLNL